MKFHRIFLAAAFCLGLAESAPRAEAQQAQVYQIIYGGTSRVPASTTNTVIVNVSTNTYGIPGTGSNLVMQVAEFDYVGLTWTFTGSTNASLLIYKSFDNGVTFNTNAADFNYLNQTAGTGIFTTNAALDVHGVTHLGFGLQNRGVNDETNLLLEINCKSPKFGSKSSTR